jgi:1-phosphatidylinositol phosphodiesterase
MCDGHSFVVRLRASALLLAVLFALGPLPASARGRYYNSATSIETSHPDWMKWIPNTTRLSAISIPGTHDTMALYGGSLAQTQSLNLRSQLNAGIRATDIRCRHIGDRFAIHHGVVYQNANFDDVLSTAVQFLKEHPTETILMRVKEEHTPTGNTRSFAETFRWYRAQPAYNPYIWPGTTIPTLGEVRGKIVILDDFGGGHGISWQSLQIQDDYVVNTVFDIDDKWEKVKNHLVSTNGGSSANMYVNFLSGSSAGAYPNTVAGGDGGAIRGVNDYALEYLVAGNVQRTGVMMMDFPGAGLIDAIIAHSFRLTSDPSLQNDFSTIFKNVAHSFHGDAAARWNQIQTFLFNVLPGRNWHWMALTGGWGAWLHLDGLFAQSDSVDGYYHIAFTSRTLDRAVSNSYLGNFVNGQIGSLSGGAGDRAIQLQERLSARFPFQLWSVVVKQAPGGLSNWAYTSYGTDYKVASGDYIYAAWGYSLQDGVYLFEHAGYEGDIRQFTSSNGWFGDLGFNDVVSSVRVVGNYQARLWSDSYGRGASLSVTQNLSSMPTGWNDIASSIDVWRY